MYPCFFNCYDNQCTNLQNTVNKIDCPYLKFNPFLSHVDCQDVEIGRHYSPNFSSLTIVNEDHATLPWSVESTLMKCREKIKIKPELDNKMLSTIMYYNKNQDKRELDALLGELEKKQKNHENEISEANKIDYNSVNFYYEYNKDDQMYFVCNTALLSMHPISHNFDFILYSMNMEGESDKPYLEYESIYCVSKHYGVFYTNGLKQVFIIQIQIKI